MVNWLAGWMDWLLSPFIYDGVVVGDTQVEVDKAEWTRLQEVGEV